jgi:plastocyanin
MLKVFVVLLLLPFSVFAYEIRITDQHGEPVKDAVVSIPQGTIEQTIIEPAIMDQIDRQFVPLVLAIEKGQEVVFPNSDNIRHHVYSFSKPKNFQIRLYQGVPKTPLSFNEVGVVVLGCNIHDSMIGYIFVSPWPNFEVTSVSGQLSFDNRPKELAVWHPWVLGLKKPLMFSSAEIEARGGIIELDITRPKPAKKLNSKFRKFYNK